ncbi:MAG TPA: hypothetical protein DGG95_13545 [Cytophagales bacterium]|jgi:hypothetical protein|nr:hypothetical protein [Cytophagales bacterium]
MEISGTVVAIQPLQTGQGKNGTWKKQEFIIETPGQYPKKACLSLWGDKVDEGKLSIGEKITAAINIESREYNGRWYTEVRAWKIQKDSNSGGNRNAPPPAEDNFIPESNSTDDLPF